MRCKIKNQKYSETFFAKIIFSNNPKKIDNASPLPATFRNTLKIRIDHGRHFGSKIGR